MSKVLTPEFRVSYPNVFKPKMNKLSGKEEYSLVALFKKGENLKMLQDLMLAALAKKWGAGQVVKGTPHKNGEFYFKTDRGQIPIRLPFRDQGENRFDEQGQAKSMPNGYEAGAFYINLKSKDRPQVVNQAVQPIIDEVEFYAGCYARASVTAFAYDQQGNRGVSFGLGNIQKTRDGEPLGGRTRAEDDFQPLANVEGATGDANALFT